MSHEAKFGLIGDIKLYNPHKVREPIIRTFFILTFVAFFCLLPFTNANAASNQLLDKVQLIDTEIQQNMKRFNIPGMAFVLANEEGIIYAKGYGFNEFGGTQKVNSQTNFKIGSISKVFTSLAIMQLRDQGLVQLDVPVKQYLPWFATKDTSLSGRITVRDLLHHTSGLPGRLNAHDVEGSDMNLVSSQLKHKLQNVHLVAPPGEKYEYTNMNYDLLQLIAEQVTKQPFPDYMSQKVFHPLGMSRTAFTPGNPLSNSATGHRYIWGDIHPFHENLSFATLGSAGLSTNAEDLGKYISFLLSSSSKMGNSVLHSTSLTEMQHATISDESIGHGYGWDITRNTIEKTGGLPGFTANLIVFPGRDYGFALLANSKQNITDETNFNISRILEGGSPSYLSKQDFPSVSSENKIILGVSALLIIVTLLMWLPTIILRISRNMRYSFKRPNLITILMCWVLNGFMLIGVLYYIFYLVPYESGVPSLDRLTIAPDFVNGLTILSISYLAFSISLVCKSLLRRSTAIFDSRK
ncbi:serine hydrolase domain-containing protein [Paenibacillus sp.]|uniref:serine hydrolase domain-containing protein n=1 Tax=Paenibacillus sp. TaxID=58172 RepID=UPI0028187CCA|nr:serine hydrolase domain-containing protein [Paenibacillus sp.]MDR0267802.1 beta-lactamase family protein [Paenibacillus sp.]